MRVKERPIIFSAPMVGAILSGDKTQTRRVVKPGKDRAFGADLAPCEIAGDVNQNARYDLCPYGQPGDRLWVRETWARYNIDQESHDVAYRATIPDDWPQDGKWRPSIFMPRWASRITLEVTGVRVERLQDISEQDARGEGIIDGGCLNCGMSEPCGCADPQPDAKDAFIWLWESINGPGSWGANPWVWVVEFEKLGQEVGE